MRKDIEVIPLSKGPEWEDGECFKCGEMSDMKTPTIPPGKYDEDEEPPTELAYICNECVEAAGPGIMVRESGVAGWYASNGFESVHVIDSSVKEKVKTGRICPGCRSLDGEHNFKSDECTLAGAYGGNGLLSDWID